MKHRIEIEINTDFSSFSTEKIYLEIIEGMLKNSLYYDYDARFEIKSSKIIDFVGLRYH